jgi:hypothetical protein
VVINQQPPYFTSAEQKQQHDRHYNREFHRRGAVAPAQKVLDMEFGE